MLVAGCASTDQGVVAREATPIIGPESDTEAVRDDPDVRIITLKNGLTVYLRENDRPGGSVEMRLAINAGSVKRTPTNRASPTSSSTCCSTGPPQFPANDLIDTLRGFGMAFGADVNAYTSYDETVYELTVSDQRRRQTWAHGLDVLGEWLSAATLDPDQVDARRASCSTSGVSAISRSTAGSLDDPPRRCS